VIALRIVQRVREALVEHVAIGQACQRVVRRDVQQIFLGLLPAMNWPIWLPITRHHLQQRRIGNCGSRC